MCTTAEYFYKLCLLLKSPSGEFKYKQRVKEYIDLAKPKSGARIFFPHVSRAQHIALARTRTRVVRLGAQCTDHWTTGQSRGVGAPAVQLTTHDKSSTLYGRTVVLSYYQIF